MGLILRLIANIGLYYISNPKNKARFCEHFLVKFKKIRFVVVNIFWSYSNQIPVNLIRSSKLASFLDCKL